MGKRMTREEFLEAVFSRRYEELKGRELRTVRVRVVGKELSLGPAHRRDRPAGL